MLLLILPWAVICSVLRLKVPDLFDGPLIVGERVPQQPSPEYPLWIARKRLGVYHNEEKLIEGEEGRGKGIHKVQLLLTIDPQTWKEGGIGHDG